MDNNERKVFRRKMPIIAEILDFSPASQKTYTSRGLLRESMVPTVMRERTKTAQMYKYLELLSREKFKNPMQKLMALLEEKGFRWLCYEMKADIKADKEQLQIEEYVYRETGIMVHAQFGKCARISEVDKKDIQLMMSWRYQVAKEAWREQMEAVERDKEELEQYKAVAEAKMKVYYDALAKFLNENEDKLDPGAVKLLEKMRQDNRDSGYGSGEDQSEDGSEAGKPQRDQAEMTDEAFVEFLQIMGDTSDKKARLEKERAKCVELLEMPDPRVSLDIAIAAKLNDGQSDLEKALVESEKMKDHSQNVFKEMYDIKNKSGKELQQMERKMHEMESAVHRLTEKNHELSNKAAEAVNKKKDAEANWKTWKERCMMLEKTRKLGYYNPGWYDQLYGICDIHYVRDTETGRRPPTKKILSHACRCSSTPTEDRPGSTGPGSTGRHSVLSTSRQGSRTNTPSTARSRSSNSTKQGLRRSKHGKKVKGSKSTELCTMHSLDSMFNKGNVVLKKNDFANTKDTENGEDGKDEFAYPKCNFSSCNVLYDSSSNCDQLDEKMLMKTF